MFPLSFLSSLGLTLLCNVVVEVSSELNVYAKYYIFSDQHLPGQGLQSLTPYKVDTVATINFPNTSGNFATSGRHDYVAGLFGGHVDFEVSGVYELCITSDDGSKLFLDNSLYIDFDGPHDEGTNCKSTTLYGVHKIDVEFFELWGDASLVLEWKLPGSPNSSRSVIPADAWVKISPSTLNPTYHPTSVPSIVPTPLPSTLPTSSPTPSPTKSSSKPSPNPILEPSQNLSSKPSSTPTSKPSLTPTLKPFKTPTSKPTRTPTSKPFKTPTSKPTRTPTSKPFKTPTSNPTKTPTSKPSRSPTSKPSRNPSRYPTSKPSRYPTSKPSRNPTSKPSTKPSVIHPSTSPSIKPSPNPTSKRCPPYIDDRVLSGCGGSEINETISPSSGTTAGGTVIEITNIKYCLTSDVGIYCRFKNDNYVEVIAGIRVDKATIECVSPLSGGASSTEVSYAVFIPDCPFDPKEVKWNVVDDNFEYSGDLAGVVLISTFGGDESSRLTSAGKEYIAKWNSNALLLSVTPSAMPSLEIFLEVLAYSYNEDPRIRLNKNPTFRVIYSQAIPEKDFDNTKFVVSGEAIEPAMNTYSTGIERVAFILVRIVAFTPPTNSKPRRIHATKTSKLIGMLPTNTDTRMIENSCPVRPLDSCEQENVPPCPPTYNIAENDFNFSTDESCIWPSGEGDCVVASDLELDLYEACLDSTTHRDYARYCGSIDQNEDFAENCDCKYFQPSAAGCVKNGNTQCCYSPSGGLITDPRDGGGTRKCSSDGFLENFRNDILPYMYCCKLNDNCESYYTERPSVSDEDYINPQLPIYTFGDPHLESFDNENFDFNGYGEYVAFCGRMSGENVANNIGNCQPSSEQVLQGRDTTSVHYRFATLEDTQNGTVTVGVAIEDPTFRNGLHALSVVRHPNTRLEVYDGSDKVIFPVGRKNKRRKKRKKISGASIKMTPVIEDDNFNVVINFKSGLIIRVRETVGVLTISFVRRPTGTEKYVGLLGIPDDDATNDFTAANGTVLNITTYPSVSEKYEGIFHNFGKTWMVPSKNSSLFKELGASNDFDIYHFPDYLPNFTHFEADSGCVPEVCGNFTGFLRESCCFDYAVTNNTAVVRQIMGDALKEDIIRDILNNTVPKIEGEKNQFVSVEIGENATFTFRAYDEDGDNITVDLDLNDRNLFELSVDTPGLFRLSFAGTQSHDTYTARASIADGKSSILFTASVYVAPPPCVNDRSFRHKGNKKKSCIWVGEDESRRQNLCSERVTVRSACRMTCGLCCKDVPDYKYTTSNGSERDCKWTARNEKRTKKYCKRKRVRSNCPITCRNCQDKYACINDISFKVDTGNGKKSCAWIGYNEVRRLTWCPQRNVRKNCPTTCGLCCENDRKFAFKTELNTMKSCAWISKKISRINKYCPQSHIKAHCAGKKTCNSCQSFVEPDL